MKTFNLITVQIQGCSVHVVSTLHAASSVVQCMPGQIPGLPGSACTYSLQACYVSTFVAFFFQQDSALVVTLHLVNAEHSPGTSVVVGTLYDSQLV